MISQYIVQPVTFISEFNEHPGLFLTHEKMDQQIEESIQLLLIVYGY